MYKMNFLKATLLFVFGFLLVGCGEDVPGGGGTGGGTNANPTLTLTSASTLTADVGSEFTMSISATANSASPLKTLTVYEGNTKLEVARFKIDGTQAAANPKLLLEAAKTSFTADITITASNTVGDVTYSAIVADEAGNTDKVEVVVSQVGAPPTLTYMGSASFQAAPNELRRLNLSGAAGGADLYSLGITENGEAMPLERVLVGNTAVPSNPFGFPDEWNRGFDNSVLELYIKTPATAGTYNYEVTLTDKSEQTSKATFTVTVGSSLEELDEYLVLLNSAGPQGTGGVDLDANTAQEGSVGSSDERAEIKDLGINSDLPAGTNWRKRIAPANDAQMKVLKPGQNGLSEDFTFASLSYKEQLPSLWENGSAINASGSEVVNEGDVFIVSRSGKYYVVKVHQINATSDNNEDNYLFDLKR